MMQLPGQNQICRICPILLLEGTVIVGSLSKLNDENKWILYNTGRHVIDNEHFTKIQLIRSENSILTKVLNSDNSSHSDLML